MLTGNVATVNITTISGDLHSLYIYSLDVNNCYCTTLTKVIIEHRTFPNMLLPHFVVVSFLGVMIEGPQQVMLVS